MMIISRERKNDYDNGHETFLDRGREKRQMATNKKDGVNSTDSFKKTGKTKTICNYPADEYEVTSEKGKMYIWYLKTDFVSFPLLGMMGRNPMAGKMRAYRMTGLICRDSKNFLMAEMEKDDKKVIETISISKTDFTFSSDKLPITRYERPDEGNYGQ